MMNPTRDDFDFHCKNCVNNRNNHWCDNYNCNPYHALIFCGEDNFLSKEVEEGVD